MTIGQEVKGFRGWLDYTGHTSSDTNWSAQYIYEHMLKVRAAFIKNKLSLGMKVGYENYKTIPCVKLIKVDRMECPCIPSKGCSFMKTVIDMPRHLDISYVGSQQGEISYGYIEWNDIGDVVNHRMKAVAEAPYYTWKNINDRTPHYLYNDIHKKYLTETFIPYDPIEYALMPDCNGKVNHALNAFEVEFVMDAELGKIIHDETYKSLVAPRPKDADVFPNNIKDMGLPNK